MPDLTPRERMIDEAVRKTLILPGKWLENLPVAERDPRWLESIASRIRATFRKIRSDSRGRFTTRKPADPAKGVGRG